MRFDPECVKTILQAYEDLPANNDNFDLGITQFSQESVYHHQLLLGDADYIIFKNCGTNSSPYTLLPVRITMKGQEFLNESKNADAWAKVRSSFAKTGAFVTSIASEVMKEYIKSQLLQLL